MPFDADGINGLLGTNISKEEMLAYFRKIDLEYDEASNEGVRRHSVTTCSVWQILQRK